MKCTAHSARTKLPCQKDAIKGSNVCRNHGGSAPQVKERAKLRLLEASDPAAALLVRQMNDKKLDETVRQRAALAILDRAGLSVTSKHEHAGPKGGAIAVSQKVDVSGYPVEVLQALQAAVRSGAEIQLRQLSDAPESDE